MEEWDEFYVVRKGNTIAVYKDLSNCEAQVSSSISDPAVSVFKGYAWCKETEEYLISRGLKNPLYTIDASEMKDDLFGTLVPCSFQDSKSFNPSQSLEALCKLQFHGASIGNPGKGGAAAVLRTEEGKLICRLSEGLDVVTNNVAEYRAAILGLKYAISKGFKRIDVRGDSMLIVNQVQGYWQCKHPNMIPLHKQVIELKSEFKYFNIKHVRREFNVDADHQANLAAELQDGEISEDYDDRS